MSLSAFFATGACSANALCEPSDGEASPVVQRSTPRGGCLKCGSRRRFAPSPDPNRSPPRPVPGRRVSFCLPMTSREPSLFDGFSSGLGRVKDGGGPLCGQCTIRAPGLPEGPQPWPQQRHIVSDASVVCLRGLKRASPASNHRLLHVLHGEEAGGRSDEQSPADRGRLREGKPELAPRLAHPSEFVCRLCVPGWPVCYAVPQKSVDRRRLFVIGTARLPLVCTPPTIERGTESVQVCAELAW